MSETDPLRRLLDLFVFAPIGLAAVATSELPQLIASGRAKVDNQLTLAKFIGKMAVNQAKLEVQRRLDETERTRHGTGETALEAPEPIVAVPVDLNTVSLPEALIELVAESPLLDAPATADLPIDGYDSLAASQVVGRLGSLTDAELDAVEAYETSRRARRTILGKIKQLRVR